MSKIRYAISVFFIPDIGVYNRNTPLLKFDIEFDFPIFLSNESNRILKIDIGSEIFEFHILKIKCPILDPNININEKCFGCPTPCVPMNSSMY